MIPVVVVVMLAIIYWVTSMGYMLFIHYNPVRGVKHTNYTKVGRWIYLKYHFHHVTPQIYFINLPWLSTVQSSLKFSELFLSCLRHWKTIQLHFCPLRGCLPSLFTSQHIQIKPQLHTQILLFFCNSLLLPLQPLKYCSSKPSKGPPLIYIFE